MNLRFILLPGGDGANDYGWISWLKTEIIQRGWGNTEIYEEKVVSPAIRAERLAKKYQLTPDTIVIGHSFGGLTAFKWVEYSGQKIAGMLVVDPSVREAYLKPWEKDEDQRGPYFDSWDWKIDFPKIKSCVPRAIILGDETLDAKLHGVWKLALQKYAENLGAEFRFVKGEEMHFCAGKEPLVLEALSSLVTIADS